MSSVLYYLFLDTVKYDLNEIYGPNAYLEQFEDGFFERLERIHTKEKLRTDGVPMPWL